MDPSDPTAIDPSQMTMAPPMPQGAPPAAPPPLSNPAMTPPAPQPSSSSRGFLANALQNFVFSLAQGAAAQANAPPGQRNRAGMGAAFGAPQLLQEIQQKQRNDAMDRLLKIQEYQRSLAAEKRQQDALATQQAMDLFNTVNKTPGQEVPSDSLPGSDQLGGTAILGHAPIPLPNGQMLRPLTSQALAAPGERAQQAATVGQYNSDQAQVASIKSAVDPQTVFKDLPQAVRERLMSIDPTLAATIQPTPKPVKARAPKVNFSNDGIPLSVTDADNNDYVIGDTQMPPTLKPLADAAVASHKQRLQEQSAIQEASAARQSARDQRLAEIRNIEAPPQIKQQVGSALMTKDQIANIRDLVKAKPYLVGPVSGQLEKASQGMGTTFGLQNPADEKDAATLANGLGNLLINEVRVATPGRTAVQYADMIKGFSAQMKDNPNMLEGFLVGAEKNADLAIKLGGRFGINLADASPSDTVKVKDKSGAVGFIPRVNLPAAIRRGAQVVP